MILIKMVNDGTGDFVEGNYVYEIFVNNRRIMKGLIEGHNRFSGVQGLIRLLVENVSDKDDSLVDLSCEDMQE